MSQQQQQQQQQQIKMCDSSTQYEENPVAQDPHICGICLCETWGEEKSETTCDHVFHTDCMKAHILHEIKTENDVKCPMCRQVYMTKKLFYENIKRLNQEREAMEATEATASVSLYDAEGHSEFTSDEEEEEDQRTFAEIYDANEAEEFGILETRRNLPNWTSYNENTFLNREDAPNREHIVGVDSFMTEQVMARIEEAREERYLGNQVNEFQILYASHTAHMNNINLVPPLDYVSIEYDPWGRMSQQRLKCILDAKLLKKNNETLLRMCGYTAARTQIQGWANDGDHILKRSVRCFNCNYLTQRPHRFVKGINGKQWYCKNYFCKQKHDEIFQHCTDRYQRNGGNVFELVDY